MHSIFFYDIISRAVGNVNEGSIFICVGCPGISFSRPLHRVQAKESAGVEILGIGKKCPKQKRLRATHIDLILIMGSW